MFADILLPFVPISTIIAPMVILYYFIKFRHHERMAIIEKGLDSEQLAYFHQKNGPGQGMGFSVKLAAVLIGTGLAILISLLFAADIRDNILAGLLFLLPGINLALVYFLEDKKENKG